jgi:hypothetical protein
MWHKYFLLPLGLLVPVIAGCSPEPKSPAEVVFEKCSPSVVKVYSLLAEGQPGRSGTGFAIQFDGKPVQILTNKHLTDNASVIVVETPTDIWVTEKWIEHTSLDAALLEVPTGKNLPTLKLGSASQAKPGQAIFVVGYPLGDSISIQPGHISALGMGDLVFNAPFSQGASGSPLLDSRGQVIGLCHSYMREAQNHNLATPLDLLDSAKETWTAKTGQPDSEVLAYLDKISSVKKVLQRQLGEWIQISQDMPEWYTWVGKSMLTRKPLAEALENVFLAVHSIQWSQLSNPGMRISSQFEAALLGQKAQALNKSWEKHSQNLQHLTNSKPRGLPNLGEYSMQQLVGSTHELSEQLRTFLRELENQPNPDLGPLTLALQKYLEHENICFASGLP